MAFSFDPTAHAGHQIREVAISQIDKAIDTVIHRTDDDEAIHGLRQRCKRLRAVIQAIRPRYKHWREDDRHVRDLARLFARHRDNAVLAKSFDALSRRVDLSEPALRGFRVQLETPLEEDLTRRFDEFLVGMEGLRLRVDHWPLSIQTFGLFGPGIQANYRRMRDGMTVAEDDPLPENFHEWRKYAKYHYHHLTLLRKTAPDVIAPYAGLAKGLADILGQHHDLAVLRERMVEALPDGAELPNPVLGTLVAWQHRLEHDALRIGRQLAAEKPVAFIHRLTAYWRFGQHAAKDTTH